MKTVCASLAWTCCAQAQIWHVDLGNATGTEDGTSWSTAFTTIQPAIDAAHDAGGGEVWIAEGVYSEHRESQVDVNPEDGPSEVFLVDSYSLVLKANVSVYGGFSGTESNRDDRDWVSNVTVIDGSEARNGGPAHYVTFTESDVTLDGVTVKGGNASGPSEFGAGLRIVDASPIIRNCTFTQNQAKHGGAVASIGQPQFINCVFEDNSAERFGGAIYGIVGILHISDSVFRNNVADRGGALEIRASGARVENSKFEDNQAESGGVAYFVGGSAGSTTSFTNCEFKYLSATVGAGGVLGIAQGNAYFTNCLMVGNTAVSGGAVVSAGGVFDPCCGFATHVFFNNCTMANNVAPNSGGVIFNSVPVEMKNTILWDNDTGIAFKDPDDREGEETVSFSIVEGGYEGESVFDFDPIFADPANGDYRLRNDSPAIDAGTEDGAPNADINGIARPQGMGIDLGAYENDGSTPPPPPPLPMSVNALTIVLTVFLLYKFCPPAIASQNPLRGKSG